MKICNFVLKLFFHQFQKNPSKNNFHPPYIFWNFQNRQLTKRIYNLGHPIPTNHSPRLSTKKIAQKRHRNWQNEILQFYTQTKKLFVRQNRKKIMKTSRPWKKIPYQRTRKFVIVCYNVRNLRKKKQKKFKTIRKMLRKRILAFETKFLNNVRYYFVGKSFSSLAPLPL